MSTEKKLKEATDLLRNIVSLSNSQYSLKCLFESINKAQEWLNKSDTPTYIDILKKVGYIYGNLWDRLNEYSDVFGMNAFILCGDHMTMNKISDALLSFSREQSLHAEIRELNKDDKIVSIEKKGYFMLSVNGRAYLGVPVFSGGYLRD